jgi:lipopolysaccharide export LptBFGC system permease protein LptF
MSKTLFWYIFRDLLRIFFMASGALAGIMSFGGLLRPLTENGLDASQVAKMLTYFSPAMTTYSFPVAALFAATMVYGRLSADNELTACRASGISFLSMSTPAIVLGLTVALVSLMFLCFVVPIFTFKVEQVIYSNLAQLVQNKIERTHQIKLEKLNVYAQSARIVDVPPEEATTRSVGRRSNKDNAKDADKVQCVELTAPMIATYTVVDNPDPDKRLPIATEFFLAKRAYVFIDKRQEDVELTVKLENASRFTRNAQTDVLKIKPGAKAPVADVVSVQDMWFGPVPMRSPIAEEAKFMTIGQLKELYESPETSRRLQDDLRKLIREEQSRLFLERILLAMRETGRFVFRQEDGAITLTRGELEGDMRKGETELVLQSKPRPEARQVKLTKTDKRGVAQWTEEAMEMRLRATPRWDDKSPESEFTFDVDIDAFDEVITIGQGEEDVARHKKFSRPLFDVPMTADLVAVRRNTIDHYLESRILSPRAQTDLLRSRNKLMGRLQSEIHSRASFAVSCLVLVLVGCALGMMFRSSNFLSAFAVSFIPAMFSIALIVTGQQICSRATNSATLGLSFIWGGNGLVLALAVGLISKLQRM